MSAKSKPAGPDSPQEIIAQLRVLLAEAEQIAQQGEGDPEAVMGRLRQRFQHTQERIQDFVGSTRDSVVEGLHRTDATIRRHPYESLGVALGVGVLVGALTGALCRRRE